MTFRGMLRRFAICCDSLLLKEHVPRAQGGKWLGRDPLEHHDESSLKLLLL